MHERHAPTQRAAGESFSREPDKIWLRQFDQSAPSVPAKRHDLVHGRYQLGRILFEAVAHAGRPRDPSGRLGQYSLAISRATRALSDKTLTLLILAVLVAGAGYLLFVNRTSNAPIAAPGPVTEPAPARRPGVGVSMEACKRQGDIVVVLGHVENTGTVDLTHVTVRTIWKDKAGFVIRTGLAYAVDGTPLAPGERRGFRDTTEGRSVESCKVEILDYWALRPSDQPTPGSVEGGRITGSGSDGLERATRFELATASLGSWGSTN